MSFINNVLNVVREIAATNEEQRQAMIKSTRRLAEAYVLDLFRAADFVANVTTNMDKQQVVKLVMPSTSQAVKVMNEEMNKAFTPPAPTPTPTATENSFKIDPKANPWIPNKTTWANFQDNTNG